jgi:hypothetical protein
MKIKLGTKMENYSRIAKEYGVCVRTVIRWKDSGCDIKNPKSVAEFVLSCKTSKIQNVFQKLSNGDCLFSLDQMVNITDFNRKEKTASSLDRLKAKIEALELRQRAADLEYFAKNGIKKVKKNSINDLYLIKNKRNGLYKIGVSVDPLNREKTLQSQEPEIEMVKNWHGRASTERWWHNNFKEHRIRGEWFELTPQQVRFMIHKMNDTGD